MLPAHANPGTSGERRHQQPPFHRATHTPELLGILAVIHLLKLGFRHLQCGAGWRLDSKDGVVPAHSFTADRDEQQQHQEQQV